ncbi:MAG: CDP-diacylglycerol--glycerol-3-phosphate 3-phosphatidyltransferase [Bdellovibrio sp.]
MEWKKKIPNWLTWFRILLVLPLTSILWLDDPILNWWALALYLVAAITDYGDGYFARKFEATSIEGQLLDPVADKVLVTSLLVMLLYQSKVDPLMVILILSRDLLVGGFRSIAAGEGRIMAAQKSGKWKTALQMLALPLTIIEDTLRFQTGWDLSGLGFWLLWVGTLLSLASGFQYFRYFQKSRQAQASSKLPL